MEGAAEVQEDEQLKVELPIDQVKHQPHNAPWWGLCHVILKRFSQESNNLF